MATRSDWKTYLTAVFEETENRIEFAKEVANECLLEGEIRLPSQSQSQPIQSRIRVEKNSDDLIELEMSVKKPADNVSLGSFLPVAEDAGWGVHIDEEELNRVYRVLPFETDAQDFREAVESLRVVRAALD